MMEWVGKALAYSRKQCAEEEETDWGLWEVYSLAVIAKPQQDGFYFSCVEILFVLSPQINSLLLIEMSGALLNMIIDRDVWLDG